MTTRKINRIDRLLNMTTRDITVFLFLTIFIFLMAGASWLVYNDVFNSLLFVFCLSVFFYTKQKVDTFIIVLLFAWISINLLSGIVNNYESFKISSFLGVTMKIFLPYFLIKIAGRHFFSLIVHYIYSLTIVALIIFSLYALFPFFFQSISNSINFLSVEEQQKAGGWYVFVYMHNAWAYSSSYFSIPRNSGFMWEPGGFASILIFALTIHLNQNNFRFDKITAIFTLGVLSTFSTAGYIGLFFLSAAFLLSKGTKNVVWIIFLSPIFIYVSYLGFQLEFISGKLATYEQNINLSYLHESGVTRVNRFAAMKYAAEQSLFWPFGNGILESAYMKRTYGVIFDGSNTFAKFLNLFGIAGLIYIINGIYRFYKSYFHQSVHVTLMICLALFSILFSNSFEMSPLVYILIYFPLIYIRPVKDQLFH